MGNCGTKSKIGVIWKKEEPYVEEPIPVGSDGYLGPEPITTMVTPAVQSVTITTFQARPPPSNSTEKVGDVPTATINKEDGNKNAY